MARPYYDDDHLRDIETTLPHILGAKTVSDAVRFLWKEEPPPDEFTYSLALMDRRAKLQSLFPNIFKENAADDERFQLNPDFPGTVIEAITQWAETALLCQGAGMHHFSMTNLYGLFTATSQFKEPVLQVLAAKMVFVVGKFAIRSGPDGLKELLGMSYRLASDLETPDSRFAFLEEKALSSCRSMFSLLKYVANYYIDPPGYLTQRVTYWQLLWGTARDADQAPGIPLKFEAWSKELWLEAQKL